MEEEGKGKVRRTGNFGVRSKTCKILELGSCNCPPSLSPCPSLIKSTILKILTTEINLFLLYFVNVSFNYSYCDHIGLCCFSLQMD